MVLACLDFERAVSEYGKLAAYPSERQSVMANDDDGQDDALVFVCLKLSA